MNIEHYSFGEITIDGRRYDSDVLIYPDGVVDESRWRREGHQLSIEDICQLLIGEPETIIAGTGASGMMRPDPDLQHVLRNVGVDFQAVPTEQAIKLFNLKCGENRIAACLHLTC